VFRLRKGVERPLPIALRGREQVGAERLIGLVGHILGRALPEVVGRDWRVVAERLLTPPASNSAPSEIIVQVAPRAGFGDVAVNPVTPDVPLDSALMRSSEVMACAASIVSACPWPRKTRCFFSSSMRRHCTSATWPSLVRRRSPSASSASRHDIAVVAHLLIPAVDLTQIAAPASARSSLVGAETVMPRLLPEQISTSRLAM